MSEFDKVVGEFQVQVSEPYPYWISITHQYSEEPTKFEHAQLDDLIYALERARDHIKQDRENKRRLSSPTEERGNG